MSNENNSVNILNSTVTEKYDETQIQVLEGLEAVRKRPGMYIGSTGERGLHHLVYEIVDNSIDEALAGYCTHIEVDILPGDIIRVTDNGRGIPIGMHQKMGIPAVEVVFTILHAGGKFGEGGYKVAGGLHGVGASVVNALSEYLEVEVSNGEHVYRQRYERGKVVTKLEIVGDTDKTGTRVTFKPDPTLFTDTTVYDFDTLAKRLQEQSFLNAGIKVTLTDRRENEPRSETFHYEGGIRSYCEYLLSKKSRATALHSDVIYMATATADSAAEIALQFNDGYDTTVISFANNMHTVDGGTHETAFKTSITRVINNYARKFKFLKDNDANLKADDVQEGLIAVVSVKLKDAQFESQTKAKLGNTSMGTLVSKMVGEQLMDYLENNPAVAKVILNKAVSASNAREAAQKARELERKKTNTVRSRMPEKLTDCISSDATHIDRADDGFKHFARHSARAQQALCSVCKQDNCRLDPYRAVVRHEHGVDFAVKVVDNMLRGRRARSARQIGRRRGERAAGQAYDLARNRVRRHSHCNSVKPCRNAVGQQVAFGQHHRQRAGPVGFGQLHGGLWYFGHKRLQFAEVADMYDERVVLRPALGLEHAHYRVGVKGVGRKAVDRLGRDRDDFAVAKQLGGFFYAVVKWVISVKMKRIHFHASASALSCSAFSAVLSASIISSRSPSSIWSRR